MNTLVSIGSLIKRKRLKSKNYNGNAEVYAVTNKNGFVKSSTLHDFQIHSEDTSNYSVVEHNDFAYNPSRLNIGSIAYYQGDGAALISPMYVVFEYDKTKIIPEFLYLLIKSSFVMHKIDSLKEEGARFRFDFSRWDLINVYLPSLNKQSEIVANLHNFTSSVENLKQQLEQRKKQFEYYKEKLLDLEGQDEVAIKKLGDLFSFRNGLNKGKEFFGKGNPIIMYSNVYKNTSIKKESINSLVTITEKELNKIDAQKGDVFFTRTSEVREEVGISSVLLDDIEGCTFAGFLIRARPTTEEILPSYCKYCFSTQKIHNQIIANSVFTTRASLTGSGLSIVKIHLPSINKQREIVAILDVFEASISNLEEQIEMRQKQFEFYRNKLLTFE